MKIADNLQIILQKTFNILSLLIIFSIISILHTQAAPDSFVLKAIKIDGNQRVENETITSYLPVKIGDSVTQHDLDNCLKTLFNTGYFNNVKINNHSSTIFIQVEENAIINQIAFEGNDKLKDEDLKKIIQLRSREVLSPNKVQVAQQQILEVYRRIGRYSAQVEPKIIKLPESRVNLVFDIKEGPLTSINKITFIGNKAFSNSKLSSAIISRESRWYRFFANDDRYDPERFLSDQQALQQFYNEKGYPDFQLISANATLTPDRKSFYLIFTLDEGPLYHFGTITIESDIKEIKTEDLYKCVTFQSGDKFSTKSLDKSAKEIITKISSSGYAFVNVEPVIEKDVEKNIANITFKIVEGPKVYIEKIEIVGNHRTRDYVILRELGLTEGDAYDGKHIKDAEKTLKNLGYFKDASIAVEDGSSPDKVKLIINVEEQPTGEMSLSLGYATIDGPVVSIGFKEKNLMGKGQLLHSTLTVSKNNQSINTGIVEPWFLGRQLEGSADLYGYRSSRSKSYKEYAVGTVLGVGYPIRELLYQRLNYGINFDMVRGVNDSASPILKSQAKNAVKSWVGQTTTFGDLERENQDIIGGYFLEYGTIFAGVGGSVKHLRHDLSAGYYASLIEGVVLRLYAYTGILQKMGKVIRVVDSFRLGGEELRGFDYEGVGPRDKKTDTALGGTRTWKTTAEIKFPLGLPVEWGIYALVFAECGSLWKPGQSDKNTVDKNTMRSSAGLGIAWKSPFGPISVTYGRVIKKEKFDQTRPVLVQFSSAF